ncbi:hypothetical protein IEQ34_011403 [Dendrobium chrysotoxum]|uniref:R13L1/DRL21-like LRR repeat region domain-containing protein n=1 Tax=Dendrobium chrysotoxum TaxID=161865 RepID=A0AAV7GS86_DENCH|nr:hypothetical protein IEQ34_011403 [Dendrobium chrysotoxum]
MGKTTLSQHAYEMTEGFDPKIWIYVSINFNAKRGGAIVGEIVKKLSGSPLAAKVIGGVLKDNLDERHWRIVQERNLLGQNPINSILRLSYIVPPKHLQNCFCILLCVPTRLNVDKDDLVRMWIALGFIQPSQGMIIEVAIHNLLCAKRRLTYSTLSWSKSYSKNIESDENVFDNPLPPKCLRNLSAKKDMDAKSVIWMNNVNQISSLEKVEMIDCNEWEKLFLSDNFASSSH